ncbi:hypothetical protein [Vibrio fluvialis]|uniref:hypothetical protein n=1 Tax=Vibrio fluvialis TaxID=676 RepID=UPI00399BF63A
MKVLWVLVNYHADGEITKFIEMNNDVFADSDVNITYTVVDNSSSFFDDGNLDLKVLRPGANLGYLPAFKFAIDEYMKRHDELPDFLVLSNSDLSIGSELKGFFHLQDKYSYDIFSSQVKTIDGMLSNPIQEFRPSRLRLLFQYLSSFGFIYRCKNFLRRWKKRSSGRLGNEDSSDIGGATICKVSDCYSVHGCFFSLSRNFFDKGGDLSGYDTFLFCEEFYISEEANKHNLKVGFTKLYEIIHEEHKYVSLVPRKRNLKWYRESLVSIYRKYY